MNAFSKLEVIPHTTDAQTARKPVALVIGSGFGGLAAALRLRAKGYEVQILEKLDLPGGRAYVHKVDGYTFDAGPTIITVPFLFDELWALFGKSFRQEIKLVSMDPFYRIIFSDGDHFDYSGDINKQRAEVHRISPCDAVGYENFIAEADNCYKLGFEALGAKAFDSLGDLFRAVPAILKMRGWRSLHGMVASHLKHPKLRIAMSLQSLLIGGNPFSVTSIYSLINALERQWGVFWPIGGTGAIIQAMVKLLAEQGVQIRLNTTVTKINVSQGKASGVTLENGEVLAADIVISNADTSWTYRHLIDSQHRNHWTDTRINKSRYSMSLFVWYFGTNRQYDDVAHHTMLLGPRYKELLKDIFKRHKLSKDFSIYLHRPTATDPSMAPTGSDTFYALVPVPNLDSGTDWPVRAASYQTAVAEVLDKSLLPGFQSHLTVSFVTTPQDFQDRLLSYKGAAFGLEPLLIQSAYFRPHNRSEDVSGLFMVGAGTHPGAGIPGVLMSAKALETVVPSVNAFN